MRSINNDNGNISNINTNSFNINQSINSNISSSISISDNSNNSTNNKKILMIFENSSGTPCHFECNLSDKFSFAVEKYRQLSKDYSSTKFIYNKEQIINFNATIEDLKIDCSKNYIKPE